MLRSGLECLVSAALLPGAHGGGGSGGGGCQTIGEDSGGGGGGQNIVLVAPKTTRLFSSFVHVWRISSDSCIRL
jgi:hypothetical protein